ncbi:MAG: EF-hand domain-containing protein [Verrucomicrobiae bacterium]|nr:EF-hand domain-containing protein [Verrucomicrobiae bacterium]NNJ43769.1 hypothetical protein [Akkermansiaceae bacterium]
MKSSTLNPFAAKLCLVIGLASAAVAQDAAVNQQGGRPLRERGDSAGDQRGSRPDHSRTKSFEAVDADKDGVLTFEEFSQMRRLTQMEEKKRRKLYDFLDRNQDGQLHMRELQPRKPEWLDSLRKRFSQLDADGDGGLDLKEFARSPQMTEKGRGMVARLFKKTDRNHDNKIERFELQWSGGSRDKPAIDFVQYDTNRSSGLDFQEYSKIPLMKKIPEERRKKIFERVDADGDGEILPSEIKAAHQGRRNQPLRRPMRPGQERKAGQERRPGQEMRPSHDRRPGGGKPLRRRPAGPRR